MNFDKTGYQLTLFPLQRFTSDAAPSECSLQSGVQQTVVDEATDE